MREQLEIQRTLQLKIKSSYFIRNIEYYLMILPGLLILLVFRFVPLNGLQLAFKDFKMLKGISGSPWVGFKNFDMLFSTKDFLKILRNTISINILELIFVFTSSIILALLLNELRNKWFKKLVQTITYLPHFLSWVIVGGFIIQILAPNSGPIRHVFDAMGIQPISLLFKKEWFYPILILGEIWKSIGWGTILYLAALSGIDQEIYEASWVDGASRWQRIWHITLPGIKFVVMMQLVLHMGHMLNVGFEKIFVLTAGGTTPVMEVAEVFSTFNYRVGLGEQRFGFSTALSLFESIIGFSLVLFANSMSKRLGEEKVF